MSLHDYSPTRFVCDFCETEYREDRGDSWMIFVAPDEGDGLVGWRALCIQCGHRDPTTFGAFPEVAL